MKKSKKDEHLEITVSRSWPFNAIREIDVKIEGKDVWHNSITITKLQAQELLLALNDILETPETPEITDVVS